MDLLISPNSVPLAGADRTPTSGTPQYATAGNAAATPVVPPTRISPAHYNMMMSELTNLIVNSGLTLDGQDWTQLTQAVRKMSGGVGSLASPGGWMTVGGGMILQYNSGNSGAGGVTNVVFPTAFPTVCMDVFVTEQHASGWVGTNGQGAPSVHGSYNRTQTGCSLWSQVWAPAAAAWGGQPNVDYGYLALGF